MTEPTPRTDAAEAPPDGALARKGGEVILAIDPGTIQSGWCQFDGQRVIRSGVIENHLLVKSLSLDSAYTVGTIAIEMISSQGMPVGQTTFETCVWIGRFKQSWRDPEAVRLIYRHQVKTHICGHPRAKDSNIRQALIDKLGPVGTKKEPGPLYGVKSHAWAAVAVAVTVFDSLQKTS